MVDDGLDIAVIGLVHAQLAVGAGAVTQHILDHPDVLANAEFFDLLADRCV